MAPNKSRVLWLAILNDGNFKFSNRSKSAWARDCVGIVTLLIGASGVFGQLKDALNTIIGTCKWSVEDGKSCCASGSCPSEWCW